MPVKKGKEVGAPGVRFSGLGDSAGLGPDGPTSDAWSWANELFFLLLIFHICRWVC